MTFISLEFMPDWPPLGPRWHGRPASVKWFTLQARTCAGPQSHREMKRLHGPARTRGLTVVTMQRGLGHLLGYWALRSHQPPGLGGEGRQRKRSEQWLGATTCPS